MKAAAALEGSTIKEYVQQAIENRLERPVARKRHRVKLPLIRAKEKGVLSLTNAQIDEILFS